MKESLHFYDALPKHKAELIDGQLYIGGSLAKSAMTLAYMVENLGAQYVLNLCNKDLLREAIIEVYGHKETEMEKLADFSPVEPSYYPPQKLATDLRMGLFQKKGIMVSGGGTAIRLGDDVFMPDIYVLKNENLSRQKDYFLDGPPDLVIEVVHPYMRPFDFGLRLERYAAASLMEVWLLDYKKRTFEPFLLEDGRYVPQPVNEQWFASKNIPGIRVEQAKLYDSTKELGVQIVDIFEVNIPNAKDKGIRFEKGLGYGSVPFEPRLDLDPVPITFAEYISWGGEVKFEMMDGKPVFGGGYETTKEWLGLLMMTLGLKETVKYLPSEAWSKVL